MALRALARLKAMRSVPRQSLCHTDISQTLNLNYKKTKISLKRVEIGLTGSWVVLKVNESSI